MIYLPAFKVFPETAARLLRDRYGLTGRLSELGSQQDANFVVTTDSGDRYVLKVSNPGTPAVESELQQEAMRHAFSRVDVAVPQLVPGLDGALLQSTEVSGSPTVARVVTFLPGEPVMDSRYFAPTVVADLGRVAAQTVLALSSFAHPAAQRSLQWDLTHAVEVVHALVHFVRDDVRRKFVLRATTAAEEALAQVAAALPRQVIHGDVTDNNVVFERAENGRPVPTGVIDFGDVVHSWRVAELAVTCASLLHHRSATPATMLPAAAAFHGRVPLTHEEAAALWPLIVLRAATLVVSGQEQATSNPSNDYAIAALEREWHILEVADSVPIAVMQAAIHQDTGHADGVRPPLRGRSLLPGLDPSRTKVVDLSYTNEKLHPGAWQDLDAERLLLEQPLKEGYAAALTQHGEYRLTRAGTDRTRPSPTMALGVEVRTIAVEPVAAPWSGRLRSRNEGVVLDGDGPRLVLTGLSWPGKDRDVATGDVIGWTREDPLWVQLSWGEFDPPQFVSPALGSAWRSVCTDPTPLLPVNAVQRVTSADLLQRRAAALANVQEHYFVEPPQIEVGWRQHLVDVEAQTYVDMVNNVAALGHGHPRIAKAVHTQWHRLNTNSRFHYGSVVEFSERLAGLLPAELESVFLVNSGSEADDLALRLAWAATGRREVVSVREAYHGWTDATDAISTSVADNPGALDSRPDWVHTVETPNLYRGLYRGDQAHRYAEDAVARIAAMAEAGHPPAAFICEPFYGNAGGLPLPDGYLESVYDAVRGVGGVCIADEVQVGYGRLGAWFWGFEQQGVVPDIVTIAKGMGNGHPLGAVITTRAIADSYRTQGYFFSSAGGSPVSSVVGLTVLDVLKEEGLQENARLVGDYLQSRLTKLAERHVLIGAVHGAGLYLGLELIRDRATLEPATEETAAICDRLRELGVIVQPTSDRMCVLKIKPPLCLTRASADRFVDALDETLTYGW